MGIVGRPSLLFGRGGALTYPMVSVPHQSLPLSLRSVTRLTPLFFVSAEYQPCPEPAHSCLKEVLTSLSPGPGLPPVAGVVVLASPACGGGSLRVGWVAVLLVPS